ncbi:hypothetical protein [Streptomyces sp. NEAU-H3]|uniref:hypothetical protein n=1 Tax=Streptomyces sp. NEAU-H3 TaxID=2720636 RepID=UPI00143BD8BC|nr:hypothetical protein [Streptomyces sp. NEAU-H3]NJA59456.1 hypothetical protein [Streptomyces sp. NEAU-H3]
MPVDQRRDEVRALLHEMAPGADLEDVVARADEDSLLTIRKRARTAWTAVQALRDELACPPLRIDPVAPRAPVPGTALAVRDEEEIVEPDPDDRSPEARIQRLVQA